MKKSNGPSKKLHLKREPLRTLNGDSLEVVRGAVSVSGSASDSVSRGVSVCTGGGGGGKSVVSIV